VAITKSVTDVSSSMKNFTPRNLCLQQGLTHDTYISNILIVYFCKIDIIISTYYYIDFCKNKKMQGYLYVEVGRDFECRSVMCMVCRR